VDEVMTPPTPVSLLPPAETEGVTSGAVQPPGSTGESVLHHNHHNKRDSAVPANDGDESDTSFTDDEDMDDINNVDEAQDEEDRLILNGGAGIPIGPVRLFSNVHSRL
jgi:RNA polymerase II subunit A small phosphatase-like protein